MKKLLKVARKRAGLKLFDVKGGVAQLRHVPGDCLVQKVLGPEEMLEDGQYITEDGASFERVSVYAEVLAESAFARSLRPTGAEINVPIGDAAFLLAADALHRSGPFTEVFFTSYGQAFSSDQFRIHSVDTPDLVLPEDMKGVRMGKKDLATFCKLARMYKAKTIKLAIFTSERGAVCVRGEFGPVSATSLCGAPDDKAEAFVAALRKFESDAARCAVPVGRLGLKHAEFVAALKAFKGKSPARLAHAYISEEGHLCPWGDRRRSAIIAQTSVKHGGGVAINLGFLKDSGAWDQDFYVARPGAMGAGQKASILISRANGRWITSPAGSLHPLDHFTRWITSPAGSLHPPEHLAKRAVLDHVCYFSHSASPFALWGPGLPVGSKYMPGPRPRCAVHGAHGHHGPLVKAQALCQA
jgi:hypothetical protein